MNNTRWLFIYQFGRIVLSGAMGIFLARILGPEEFGELSYLLSIISIVTPIAIFGQNSSVPRNLHLSENQINVVLNTLFISSILSILCFILSLILFKENQKSVVLFSILFSSHSIFSASLIAKKLSKYVALYSLTILLLVIGSRIFILISKLPENLFYWSYPLEHLLYLLVFCSTNFKFLSQKGKIRISLTTIQTNLHEGWQLLLSAIANAINLRADQLFIKFLVGFEQVGFYSVAVRLIEMIQMLPYIISKGTFPDYMSLYKNSPNSWFEKMTSRLRKNVISGCLLGAIVFLASKPVVILLYSDTYTESAEILKIYSISIPFAYIGAFNSLYLKVVGDYKNIMKRQFLNVLINIILNFLLINFIGYYGAAYATIISLMISTILFDRIMGNRELVKIHSYVFKNIHRKKN